MIECFLTEYMIINYNLCRTIYNINDELKSSKNNDKIYKNLNFFIIYIIKNILSINHNIILFSNHNMIS